MDSAPPDYLCPVTLELMEDPVVAADGFTYDRSSIQRWLDLQKRTSPKTGLPLSSGILIPNSNIKLLIESYKRQCERASSAVREAAATVQTENEGIVALTEKAKRDLERLNEELECKCRMSQDLRYHISQLDAFMANPPAGRELGIDAHPRDEEDLRAGLDDNPKAWRIRGVVLASLGLKEESIECYKKSLLLDKTDVEALSELAMVYKSLSRLAEALECLDNALVVAPSNPDLLNNRGVILYHTGKTGEALDMFQHAIALNPDSFAFWHNAGDCLRNMGSWEEALLAYNRALKIRPNDANVITLRREVLRNIRKKHCVTQ